MTCTPPSRPCLVRREARTIKERLSSWLGGGQGTCCSSLGFSLPLLPATLAERPSPSPQNGAPRPGCPCPDSAAPTARAGPGAAQAQRPPPPQGTPGVVVRAGAARWERCCGRERWRGRARARTRPASCAPQRVYTLTLGPVTSEHWPTPSSLRWLQHSTEVS